MTTVICSGRGEEIDEKDAVLVNGNWVCHSCGAEDREHAREMFEAFAADFKDGKPCWACGGVLQHCPDEWAEFGSEQHDEYRCSRCEWSAQKFRMVTDALRNAVRMRYVAANEFPMPPWEYTMSEGRLMPFLVRPVFAGMRTNAKEEGSKVA